MIKPRALRIAAGRGSARTAAGSPWAPHCQSRGINHAWSCTYAAFSGRRRASDTFSSVNPLLGLATPQICRCTAGVQQQSFCFGQRLSHTSPSTV
jgi:hypothetical protein